MTSLLDVDNSPCGESARSVVPGLVGLTMQELLDYLTGVLDDRDLQSEGANEIPLDDRLTKCFDTLD